MANANTAPAAIARVHRFVPEPVTRQPIDRNKHTAPVLGTCFAFRNPKFFVTAAHVVDGLLLEDIVIAVETASGQRKPGKARQAILHPTADIAILEIDRDDMAGSRDYFRSIERPFMGQDFFAYGFPILGGQRLDPRVFSGVFQTFRDHTSNLTRSQDNGYYKYLAGELSIACPRGLSGGPVFRRDDHDVLLAVVTENHQEGTEVAYTEESDEPGLRTVVRTEQTITYGMSVVAEEMKHWLEANIPLG